MAKPVRTKSKIVKPNGVKVEPSSLALTPFPPPNPAADLIELRDESNRKEFASKYISAEELEHLRTEHKGNQLSPDEKIAILEMSIAGLAPTVIGVRIGRSPETVRNFLSKYRPRNTLAKAYIESQSEKIARKVVRQANVEESLEILHRINVLPKPIEKPQQAANQFSIIVGASANGPSMPTQAVIDAAKEK